MRSSSRAARRPRAPTGTSRARSCWPGCGSTPASSSGRWPPRSGAAGACASRSTGAGSCSCWSRPACSTARRTTRSRTSVRTSTSTAPSSTATGRDCRRSSSRGPAAKPRGTPEMLDRLTPTWRRVALAAIAFVVLWFCWSVRSVLNPLILGYLLAFVLHPLVLKLERRGWKRKRAVNFIFGAFAALLTGIALVVFFQGRGLARELGSEQGLGAKVSERVDQALEKYKPQVQWLIEHLPRERKDDAGAPGAQAAQPGAPGAAPAPPEEVSAATLSRMFQDWWNGLLTPERSETASRAASSALGAGFGVLRGVFGSVMEFFGLLVLLPIYTWFLLF